MPSWLIFDVSPKNMEPFVITVIVGIVLIVVMIAVSSANAEKARKDEAERRRAQIYEKYGRTETAERILNKTVWVGETSEQLRDSFGEPLDVDEKVLKTKKKEIWKYVHKGTNRYGLKFTVENDVVVGWDEKV
jgi:hypothetical protein